MPDLVSLLQPQDNCTFTATQSRDAGSAITATTNVTVTATDQCNNTVSQTITVTVPDPLSATIDKTDVACNGGNNGTVTLDNIAGGTPPYTYSWTSSGTGATNVSGQTGTGLLNLTAGTYSVTITDQNGCTLVKSAQVSQAGTLTAVISSNPTNCYGGSTGSQITLSGIGGGTGTRHFAWSQTINGTTTQLTSEQDHTTISNYPAGTYTVVITDDEGCSLTLSTDIEQPEQMRVEIDNTTNIDCYGYNTGAISITAYGGDGSYNYAWTGPNGYTSSSEDLTGIPAGIYNITVTDNHECPATNSATLTEFQQLQAQASATLNPICNGASTTISVSAQYGNNAQYTYSWDNGSNQASQTVSPTTTHTYIVTVYDANNCPAQASVEVVVSQPSSGIYQVTACDSYVWTDENGNGNGQTYTASNNTAQVVLSGGNAHGCDSTITLNLTINNSTTGTQTEAVCETFTWTGGNNQTYTNNTTATYTFTGGNAHGCDSTVTLNLTVYHNETTYDTAESCETYTWNIGTNTYTYNNSGDYTNTYSIGECNGVDNLHLTINHSTTGVDPQTSCDYYVWRNGQTYTASTNTPSVTLTGANQHGCDSIITLNLTINHSTTGTDVETGCDSYFWPANGQTYYSSTNTPNVSAGLNVAGCDSTVYLNLTIYTTNTWMYPATACDSYTWPLNGQTYTASTNTPSVTLQNIYGCDSIVTLYLTVNQSRNSTVTDTVCYGSSLSFMGSTYPAPSQAATAT